MAVRTDEEFRVGLSAEDHLSPAVGRAADVADKALHSIGRLAGEIISLNQALELAKKAWDFLKDTVGEAIDAFKEADKVQVRLKVSLAAQGQLTAKNVEVWNAYAESVQEASTIDEEAALSLVAKSKAMGITDAKTRELIDTAVDLSAVFDGDVDAAFQALAGTLNGVVSRNLTRLDGHLKNLSDTQHKAGIDIDILHKKYKGFGEGLVKSTEGAEAQATNAFHKLKVNIGKLLNEIFDFRSISVRSKEAFEKIGEYVKLLEPGAKEVGAAFGAMRMAIEQIDWKSMVSIIAEFGAALAGIGIATFLPELIAMAGTFAGVAASAALAAAEFVAMAVSIAAVVVAVDLIMRNLNNLPKVAMVFGDAFLLAFSKITGGFASLLSSMFSKMLDGVYALSKAFPGHEKAALAVQKAVGSLSITMAEEAETQAKQADDMLAALKEDSKGLDLGLAGALKDQLANIIKNFKAAYKDLKGKVAEEPVKNGPKPDNIASFKMPELFKPTDLELIKGVFGEGTASFAASVSKMVEVPLAMLEAANVMLDAAQKLIDAVPGLINKAASLIESVTALPSAILGSINHLLTSITGLFKDFLVNVVKMLDGLLTGLLDFATKLPEGILDALSRIPRMLVDLTDRIPDVITRIIEALVPKLPDIAAALMDIMVARAPEIGARIAFMMAVKVPIAIAKGVLKALQMVFKEFYGKIKGIKVDVPDAKKIPEQIKKIFSGDKSKLFNVSDLVENAKGPIDQLKDLLDQAKKAGMTMWEAFLQAMKDAWEWFLQAGRKIWEGLKTVAGEVLQFFGSLGTAIWKGLSALGGAILDFFGTAGTAIWKALTTAVKDVGAFFAEWGKAIWAGLTTAIKDPLATFSDWGRAIWAGLTTAVKDVTAFFKDWGGSIWTGLTTAVKDVAAFFKGWGGSIWDGLKAALDKASDTFTGIGTTIWNGLKAGITGLGAAVKAELDKINPANLFAKMFNTSGSSGQGTVEKTLGIDVPFISFAKGGLVPGMAAVSGDSDANDKLLAAVSPGEAFISRSMMANPVIKSLVDLILKGKIPHFKKGGLVNQAKGAIGSLTGGGGGGNPLDKLKGGLGDLAKSGKAGFEGLGDLTTEGYTALNTFLGGLDPSQLWNKVLEKVGDGVMAMFRSNKFHDGGIIGGDMPMLGQRGEFVVNRRATEKNVGLLSNINAGGSPGAGGGVTIEKLEINVRSDVEADAVRSKIWPEIEKRLKQKSQDGGFVIAAAGVRA